MLSEQQLRRAHSLNRVYAFSVRAAGQRGGTPGWAHRYSQISIVLGHTGPSTPSADTFAQLVADWQEQHGISPVDGVLGQSTWAAIEPHTRFTPAPSAQVSGWLTQRPSSSRIRLEPPVSESMGSATTIPGRGWMFLLVHQLPEVGVRNVIRKVAVVPRDFVLRPRNPAGALRPAVHALGGSANHSQFLSTSNRSYGSVTGGRGAPGLLIDTLKVEQAGGRLVRSAELIQDLQALARDSPSSGQRISNLIDTIRQFEGETLIEGSTSRGAVRRLSPQHTNYLRRGEDIFDSVRSGQITRAQGAQSLQSLDDSFRSASALGRVGRGVAVVGFVMTAYDVGNATVESVEQRSFRPITAETVRQVGGWGAATAGAKLGFVAGAAVGIETGPGAIVTGAAGALIFGFAGYTGADWVADLIYEN